MLRDHVWITTYGMNESENAKFTALAITNFTQMAGNLIVPKVESGK